MSTLHLEKPIFAEELQVFYSTNFEGILQWTGKNASSVELELKNPPKPGLTQKKSTMLFLKVNNQDLFNEFLPNLTIKPPKKLSNPASEQAVCDSDYSDENED